VRVLVHSYQGDGVPLALRLEQEGHDTLLYVHDPKYRPLAANLVEHVDDPVEVVDDVDVVLFDMVGNGALADSWTEAGIAVLGGSRFRDLLELKRRESLALLDAAGCRIPETEAFGPGAFEEAIAFVQEYPDRYVFKADGNLGNDKTHVACDADEMIDYLQHLDATIDAEEHMRPPFILQTFVPGVEVSTERWYVDGAPIPAMDNSTFELKKFLAGHGTDAGLGPTVGCAGNVVIPHFDPKMLRGTVDRLDKLARLHHITGPLDLNAIVSEQDHEPYILEVTARFGYDAIQTYAALWRLSFGETIEALLDAMPFPGYRAPGHVAAGIAVTLPPYPHAECQEARGTPILDDVLDDDDFWGCDLTETPDGKIVCGGIHAILGVMTNTAPTVAAACQGMYAALGEWRTAETQYRCDLGSVVAHRLATLQKWGYLRGIA
jgi:phosphoribosylamine-glycine ligase